MISAIVFLVLVSNARNNSDSSDQYSTLDSRSALIEYNNLKTKNDISSCTDSAFFF